MTAAPDNRRPLKTRQRAWAQRLAAALARAGVAADHISIASVVVAVAGVVVLVRQPGPAGLVVAAICVQLRLLCNLLDGLVAVEGGRRSPVGVLYNEVPDRIADSLFLVALGYAASDPVAGWAGALAAAVTAYIRVLGGSLGLPQDFRGPMAKPHRMAAMTAGCLVAAVELPLNNTLHSLRLAAWIIAVGAAVTCVTRTLAIARALRAR
jgi:phosphatidylglycerophosphate synthase